MKLGERQQLFSQMFGLLLNYLPVLSMQTGKIYTVAIADAQSNPGNIRFGFDPTAVIDYCQLLHAIGF